MEEYILLIFPIIIFWNVYPLYKKKVIHPDR